METRETIRTFQGCLLPYTHIGIVQEVYEISHQRQVISFKALPFRLPTAPMEFTVMAKEVKLMAIRKGIRIHQYLDDWLVRARSHRVCLQHTQELVRMCQELGWLVNVEKSELDPKQVFDFVGYQFNLDIGQVADPSTKNTGTNLLTSLSHPAVYVLDRATNHHGEASSPWLATPWHLKKNWRVPESLEKVIPIPESLHPHLKWWLEEGNVLQGQPLHPLRHALQILTDASKKGWGTHLNEHTARGTWSLPKSKLHINYLEIKVVFLALKKFQDFCSDKTSSCSNRQHYSGVIHTQRRRHEVGLTVCPVVENPDLVLQQTGDSQSPTHSRPAECSSRQAIQARPDHPEWSLLPEIFERICNGLRSIYLPRGSTSYLSLCHQ